MPSQSMLVTKPYLPPIEEYIKKLEKIWETNWLTNNGPLAVELEEKLQEYLGVKHVVLVSNGTIAIQLALRALEVKGEVITTPFSFAATTTAIMWEGLKPVFADIREDNFGLDAELVEKKVGRKTGAIMPVHVYGYPSDVERIDEVAKKHGLKVIYDAAHAFGVKLGDRSLLSYGDAATISFHATKLFNTGEGGAVVTNDDKTAAKVRSLRDFGYEGEELAVVGINAKNSEFHAALGLCNLPKVTEAIDHRQFCAKIYDDHISQLFGVVRPITPAGIDYNFAYLPVMFESEELLLSVKSDLEKAEVFTRRYFYPALNTLPYVKYQSCPVAESVASRVLCLPLHNSIGVSEVLKVCEVLKKSLLDQQPKRLVGMRPWAVDSGYPWSFRNLKEN